MIMAYTPTTVRLGDSGLSVFILQSLLRGLQYTGTDGKPIEIDGNAGTNTVNAINQFQKAQIAYGFDCGTNGKPDGIFGKKCWNRILGV